jgi:hypothetical protein
MEEDEWRKQAAEISLVPPEKQTRTRTSTRTMKPQIDRVVTLYTEASLSPLTLATGTDNFLYLPGNT